MAEDAGLTIDDGIVVDALAHQPSDIYAAGDAPIIPTTADRRLRLESVPNAIDQGKAVASDILGAPVAYAAIPWFWSDQLNQVTNRWAFRYGRQPLPAWKL